MFQTFVLCDKLRNIELILDIDITQAAYKMTGASNHPYLHLDTSEM